MMEYIQEIQRQLIASGKFELNEKGLPKDVPDGEYPMTIDGRVDYVRIVNGCIECCRFRRPITKTAKKRKSQLLKESKRPSRNRKSSVV